MTTALTVEHNNQRANANNVHNLRDCDGILFSMQPHWFRSHCEVRLVPIRIKPFRFRKNTLSLKFSRQLFPI
ncbi:uncharacterized protein LACBIDRAFT_316420 [Laccaria bicolor S238N-H82]|uniref:Predicted protein n=1 Tax=Laccaria bicolor (strain S238N-H82 / ATCC MYA-4686) TaxID=486041 RepID=B0E0X3_LACBS|nr:uncharacterized protein LACBIDRAFT_316420 [Laccaria bicolor S238N-H82]EDQ99476.1 predicted protein [Laccaria bicolor S238N-H82]|eukprot:XP_001889825.1 predicted protein [Laccaria bicolor S238N-H82]